MQAAYTYSAYITHIYDADTMTMDIDLGMSVFLKGEKVRFFGINTPEIRRSRSKGIDAAHVERGFDARDFAHMQADPDAQALPRKAITHRLPRSIPVVIKTQAFDKSGKYGRLLVDVYTMDGKHINQALVDAGHADVNFYK